MSPPTSARGAMILLFCNGLVRVGPAAPAAAVAQEPVRFFGSSAEELELRAGFAEVSREWDEWLEGWRDSTAASIRVWGARVAAAYTTEDELLKLYTFRAEWFAEVADDRARNAVCGGTALVDEAVEVPAGELGPVPRLLGRGFARRHLGQDPWVPPLDLRKDESAWAAFADYLATHGEVELLEALTAVASGRALSDSRMCRFQSALYRLASRRSRDRIGSVRLLDFVRAIDVLGATG